MKLHAVFYPEVIKNEMQKCLQAHREFAKEDPLVQELKESAGF